MTDLVKPKTLHAALAAIAPFPAEGETATADKLAAAMAVRAQVLAGDLHNHPYITGSDNKAHLPDWLRLGAEYRAHFIAAMALRDYAGRDPVEADITASTVWEALVDGAGVEEWLHNVLTGYGIAPEDVDTAAEEHAPGRSR